MKVAPATSSDKSSFSEIASNDGTKKSSQIIASAKKQKNKMKIRRLGIHLLVTLKYVQTPYSWYNYFFLLIKRFRSYWRKERVLERRKERIAKI